MLLVIDNYDSFTFNLVQTMGALDSSLCMEVIRHDAATVPELAARHPTHVMISPGPGSPDVAGVSGDAIRHFAGRVPVLGVCLGHQCIARVWGADVVRAARPVHGKTSEIRHTGRGLFAGIPNPFPAARYHSLIVDRRSLSEDLEVTAWTTEGEIMGLSHRWLNVEGVQFHPESFLTEVGPSLLARFLQTTGGRQVIADSTPHSSQDENLLNHVEGSTNRETAGTAR